MKNELKETHESSDELDGPDFMARFCTSSVRLRIRWLVMNSKPSVENDPENLESGKCTNWIPLD